MNQEQTQQRETRDLHGLVLGRQVGDTIHIQSPGHQDIVLKVLGVAKPHTATFSVKHQPLTLDTRITQYVFLDESGNYDPNTNAGPIGLFLSSLNHKGRDSIRVGINAPRDTYKVLRGELLEQQR